MTFVRTGFKTKFVKLLKVMMTLSMKSVWKQRVKRQMLEDTVFLLSVSGLKIWGLLIVNIQHD